MSQEQLTSVGCQPWIVSENPVWGGQITSLRTNTADRYRLPLILHYFEGMSCKDAARRLKISETALYKRLERGRRTLRHRLTAVGIASGCLLMFGPVAAPACVVSAAKIESTVFVAMHAKLAWAKGALGSVANQASLTLAQGVLKTMMLTTFVNSACSVLAGLCIGFVSMSAMAQSPEANTDDLFVQVLQKSDEHVPGSSNDTVVSIAQSPNRMPENDRTKDPQVIDATRSYRATQGHLVEDPQVIDATRSYRAIQGHLVEDPQVIDATRSYRATQGQLAQDEAKGIQQRLRAINSELQKLNRQIKALRQSLENRE